MKKVIHCVGGAAIDYKLQALQSYLPHTSNPVQRFDAFGGVARNVAENLARWQAKVTLQTVVGDDLSGQQILTHLHKLGVDTQGTLTLHDQRTAHYFAAIDISGELTIAFADMQIFDAIPETFTNCWKLWEDQAILFIEANLPASILKLAVQQVVEENNRLCIDPVSVAKSSRIPLSLEKVFLIKPNIVELAALTQHVIQREADILKASYVLLERGVSNVVTSLGDQGYMWVNQTGYQRGSAKKCMAVKDVNGCGDAFVAGLLYGLAADASLLDACELGQKAALNVLTSHDSVVGNCEATAL